MTTSSAYKDIGRNLIHSYAESGTVKTGINGPYDDPETEVRNLSHLIVITAVEIKKYKHDYTQELLKMSEQLLYLADEDGLFILRRKCDKDTCNGVIGHAWVIEALVYLYKVFGEYKYIEAIKKIVKAHKFDEREKLWHRPNYTSMECDVSIDYTLNHQLWFAASLAESNTILKDKNIHRNLLSFMNNLVSMMEIHSNGMIYHSIMKRYTFTKRFKQKIKKQINILNRILKKKSYDYKEQGYHLFNLMALARIYSIFPENDFFKSRKMSKALQYVNSNGFILGLDSPYVDRDKSLNNNISNHIEKEINIYGYTYNVPGLEIMYCSKVFQDYINAETVKLCSDKQFKYTYDRIHHMFGLRCHDKIVINYRVYEYYRYLELLE